MKIFAVSDLHLSLRQPWQPGQAAQLAKPMDIFGAAWADYPTPLARRWQETVGEQDTVLIAGDISWAMTLDEAAHDLAFIHSLPGTKLLIKGNHDYWWQSLSQVKAALPASIIPLQHSAVRVGNYAVCGTRGWLTPAHRDYKKSEDEKIYQRELLRLEMALQQGSEYDLPLLVMLHYPPLLPEEQQSGFSELLERYQVAQCLYGHIHGDKAAAFSGMKNNINYQNCSVDRLELRPLLVAEAGESIAAENK